jgi:hypothetical protein
LKAVKLRVKRKPGSPWSAELSAFIALGRLIELLFRKKDNTI